MTTETNSTDGLFGTFPITHETMYQKEFCQKAFDILKEGNHLCHVAKEFQVSKATIHEWKKKYPEFKTAIDIGRASAECVHIDSIKDGSLETKAGHLLGRNMFGWDKEKKIRLKDFSKKHSKKENFDVLLQEIADKGMTGKSMGSVSSLLVDGVKVDQHAEYEERIRKLEEMYLKGEK